jgi:chorismate dehydratase
LAQRLGLKPRSRPLPIGDSLGNSTADAVLLIGDRAIRQPAGRFTFVWDLGEEWSCWTGLPFVFAMWVARPGVDLGNLADALGAARDEGVRRLDEIAARESVKLAIPAKTCRRYLRNHLGFQLGPRQREGLERFRLLAAAHRLAPVGYASA